MAEPYVPRPFQAHDREMQAKGLTPPPMKREMPDSAALLREKQGVKLDPSDPFEAALIPIVETNRRKRSDYALDGDPFSNFRGTAQFIGQPTWMSPLFNVVQKMERVKSLAANGRLSNPQNEAIEDTILDAAVYGVIAWAIYNSEKEKS
jgi:hypothetical protein